MATAANTVTVMPSTNTTVGLSTKQMLEVIHRQADANEITELSTKKVMLVFDVDSTDAHERQALVAQAEAAVGDMARQLFLVSKPSQISTSTTTNYRPRVSHQRIP